MGGLDGLRVAVLERPHPADHRGALTTQLVPHLAAHGAQVQIVHAETALHRLDVRPPWDLVVLKSGSAAALHVAAAAEAWGIPSVNSASATRLAQDKLASSLILQHAGIPIAPSLVAWIDSRSRAALAAAVDGRDLIVKAARGSQGQGLWQADAGCVAQDLAAVPPGPYLVMDRLPHRGDDLKVFVAGEWMDAIERVFPARTYEQKLGRPAPLPDTVADTARRVGALLGLTCFGCDFIDTADGWVLVDVNAFPGYKGSHDAPGALVHHIAQRAPVAQVGR